MKLNFIFKLLILALISNSTVAQINYTFKAYQTTYKSISNGISPSLNNPTCDGFYEYDEGFANKIPIGFNFQLDGETYNSININVNGFVSFGKEFDAGVSKYLYNENSLIKGTQQENIKPIIAPLWDDLKLENNGSLKYSLEGNAPNRIFTIEWNNIFWDIQAIKKSLNIQLVLFEGSNKIQFIYNSYGSVTAAAGASVGIATKNGFLSANEISTNASISSIQEFTEIKKIPADGTILEFVPAKNTMPEKLLINYYASRKINYSWQQQNNDNCDYIISTSSLQPASNYINTNLKTITASNLTANTQYYIHLRANSTSNNTSGWLTYAVKTAFETALPYIENFNTGTQIQIPENIISLNPTSKNYWQAVSQNENAIKNKLLVYKGNDIQSADGWFILPATELLGSETYKIKFTYKTEGNTSTNQKLEIKLGKWVSTNLTGWQTISKNYSINNKNFRDTNLVFSPVSDDIYFIAFRCASDKGVGSLYIDNIEISKVPTLSAKVLNFIGNRNSRGENEISWKTNTEYKNKKFELQKSLDNVNFTTFSSINSKSTNGISAVPLYYALIDDIPDYVNYYRLKVFDENGKFGFTQSIKVAGNLSSQLQFDRVYPNPASDVVSFSLNSPYTANAKMKIFDFTGKLVQEYNVSISIGDNIIRTDLSKLTKGVYFARFYCIIGGISNTQKIIKQ